MLTISVPSGRTVTAVPDAPDATGAVTYRLSGAATGAVHVRATNTQSDWTDFRCISVHLGSNDSRMASVAADLPTVRGVAYCGWITGTCDQPDARRVRKWEAHFPLENAARARPAPPQAAAILRTVMEACGQDYARRGDRLPLLWNAREWKAPTLIRWLTSMQETAESEASRYEQKAVTAAATSVTAVLAVLLFCARPGARPGLVLTNRPHSLTSVARAQRHVADIWQADAAEERRRATHWRSETETLRELTA